MNRLGVGVAALAVVFLVGAMAMRSWQRSEDAEPSNEKVQDPTPAPRRAAFRAGQREAPDRRVAGRVTFEGTPVRGAAIRLEPTGIRLGVTLESLTDGDGNFDLGEQVASSFTLSASQQGRIAAVEKLDLRDPRTHPEAVELQLLACEDRLTGKVFDPEGGVIVRARIRTPNTQGVETDEQGAYELCLPRGSNDLVIDANGYAGLRMPVVVLGRTQHDLVLSPEATVVGRVVLRGTHEPVRGALVSLIPATQGRVQPVRVVGATDASGRFRIGVAPGEHRASATGEGLSSLELVPVTAIVGIDSEEVTLELAPLSVVRGRVMNEGKAVPGARVILRSTLGLTEAFSQADGRFVADFVVPGKVTFTAEPWEVVSPLEFQVEKPEESVELEVKRLGSVKGTVTREGKPVARASVNLEWSPSHLPRSTTSDNGGHYELPGLGPGNWSLNAQSERVGAFTQGRKFDLAAGEDKVVDLELDLAATISGTVRSEDGSPVAGVFVLFKMKRNGDQGQSQTDADGHFRCTTMSGGGDYLAQVFPSATTRAAFKSARPFPAVALPHRNSHVEGVELVIHYERLEISGRVLDPQGQPIPDARVSALNVQEGEEPAFFSWASPVSAVSDSRGAFTLRALPGGTWALQAVAPDGSEAIVRHIASGSKDVVIKVPLRGGIDGTLVGFAGATPVVYAQPTSPNTKFTRAQVKADTFSVPLSPGPYLVTAMAGSEGDAQRVDVQEGTRTAVTLTNRGHATVTGVVTEHVTHAPISGLRCHCVVGAAGQPGITNWDPESAPLTDERGAFSIDPSPAGEIWLTCFGMTGETSSAGVRAMLATGDRGSFALEVVRRSVTGVTGEIGATLHPALAVVLGIRPGSPADGRLLPGDLIVAVDGEPTSALSSEGVQVLIDNHAPGSRIALTVQRTGESKSFTLLVGESN